MGENDDLEELKGVARATVSMYKAVWDEIERQFPELSIEDRHRIFSLISPFINNMFAIMMKEDAMEDFATTTGKSKKKRR